MEMEKPADKADLQIQLFQDQAVLYQLRRSSHKIQQLMQDVNRLRNDTVTQCKIIASLQEQLREAGRERVQMEECILALRGELDICQRELVIVRNDQDRLRFEEALNVLKKRYSNCQEENNVLRRQVKEKQREIQGILDQHKALQDQNDKLQEQLSGILHDLQDSAAVIADLRRFNAELELLKNQFENSHLSSLEALAELKSTYGLVGGQRREAQRGEEGWFCEFKDLKDTVEYIEQLRDEVRLRKTAKIGP